MIELFQKQGINLASAKLGANVIYATDDFFGKKERLLIDAEPVFIEDKYDENGKWMDGWESRRKREPGHDCCVIELCRAGRIHGIVIDTRFFTGNFPPSASIEACFSAVSDPNNETHWVTLVSQCDLTGNSQLPLEIQNDAVFTHLRLNIFPDGGVARLRVYGRPECNWNEKKGELLDLASALHGGRALQCNNQHFGSMHNLLTPGRGINMGDGWETRRRREPGYDWVVIALGHAGRIKNIEIDTAHFKGNFPHQCSIFAVYLPDYDVDTVLNESIEWKELLTPQYMKMNHIHKYEKEIIDLGSVTHLRLNIHPDGGVSRFRAFGFIN